MVIIKSSNIHGKGVFATENIVSGTIIECDILEVPKGRVLNDYIFPLIGNRVCIHIGFGSFINSSKNANIKHIGINIETMISQFKTTRDIELGEEITMQYM